MSENDLILTSFHNAAQVHYIRLEHAFGEQARHINREHSEGNYHELEERYVRTLRAALYEEAQKLLRQFQDGPQDNSLGMRLRQLSEDYVHRFVQHFA